MVPNLLNWNAGEGTGEGTSGEESDDDEQGEIVCPAANAHDKTVGSSK